MGKGKLRFPRNLQPVGPTERTPNKPGYLIALRGPLVRSHSIFDGTFDFQHVVFQESTCWKIPKSLPAPSGALWCFAGFVGGCLSGHQRLNEGSIFGKMHKISNSDPLLNHSPLGKKKCNSFECVVICNLRVVLLSTCHDNCHDDPYDNPTLDRPKIATTNNAYALCDSWQCLSVFEKKTKP